MLFYRKRRVLFLTYGDQTFARSRSRIIDEAKQVGVFTDFVAENEFIVEDDEFQLALSSPEFKEVFSIEKGGGCYIWKPYVICKNLSLLDEDDILVYADAGCSIDPKSKYKFHQYFKLLNGTEGVLGLKSHHVESEMCKGDVFEYFGVRENEIIYNTPKYAAGRHFFRKCSHSIRLCEKWWDVAKSRPDLFSGVSSSVENYPDFFRHIYDTGTWSIICKMMGVIDLIEGDEIEFFAIVQ